MKSLTVLSPHQDDAGLSLAMTICAAARSGRPVRIVNCFTVSAYAPHSLARDVVEVGSVRKEEDREFASRVGPSVEVVDLGMEDAPIRLGRPVASVRRLKVGPRERMDAQKIAEALNCVADGMVLAPLGLGGHIDHLVAFEAAIRLARAGRTVVFYEDLPYAAELRDCCILRAANRASRRIGARLGGALVRDREAEDRKRFAIEAYGSQLSTGQIDSVIGYGTRRGGGERLWGTKGFHETVGAHPAGIEAGSFMAAWQRRLQCAAHAAGNGARAVCRRAAESISRGGGDNVPQTN
jgi:LmbE family N-acetylglucosaminyl deacetylase